MTVAPGWAGHEAERIHGGNIDLATNTLSISAEVFGAEFLVDETRVPA